ncbi:flagellar biosynthesis protein FlgN [Aliishimia ponticola]|uniref:Flagellar biosynthesis protein FlgN n=1 Tax=Aliishimia ponticola TaxID=2499833 RepID=A0A4S4NBG2_9RHOB|nr:flagellar protein FlgN [Aliishimia ponticola]THH35321.1 flagellar biosynthesis protein FlgN [Aliishimia ponticola]
MHNDHDALIRQLDALLDVEREALLSGKLEELQNIVTEKEDLIHRLGEADVDQIGQLSPVNDKVVRNQALLEQALKGIRSVAKKLGEIRQARKTFDTYDQRGHKNRIEAETAPSVEKRA